MEAKIKELIEKIKNGDIGSFEQLVTRCNSRVSNTIYHLLGYTSDVDDLSQEVFLKVNRYIKNFKEKSNFATWLYRITVNTVWDYLRRKKNRPVVSLDQIEADTPGFLSRQQEKVTHTVQQKEIQKFVHKLIQDLPIKYRTVLILKDIEGCAYQEIANILKCSIGTVESRLFRARAALKEKIKKSPMGRELL